MKRTWVRWLGLAIVLLLAVGLAWLLWRRFAAWRGLEP